MKFNFFFIFSLITGSVFADDALVLPQGKFRVRLVTSFSSLENQYGKTGGIEGYGAPFTRTIDGALMAALTQSQSLKNAVKALNASKPGSGDALLSEKIAELRTDISTQVFANLFVVEYGLTSRISLGIIVPLLHADVDVDASSTIDQNFSAKTSTLSNADPRKSLRTNLQNGATKEAIDQILQQQFKYTGIQSWSGTGVGDIELGMKYNYFREHPLRATLKSGARFPTGHQDDPDHLFDMGFGDGQMDLAVYNYVDYDLLSNLSFTWEMGYTLQLPDSNSYRIPVSSDLPIGATAISLDRKLGDYWEAGLEANLSPFKNLILSSKYRFKQKFQDSFTGDGVDTSLLEQDTEEVLHEGSFQIEYTNLPDVKAGRERIPYGVVAFYKLPYAGENIADSRTTGLQLKTYF